MGTIPTFEPGVAVTSSDLTWWQSSRPFAVYPAQSVSLTAAAYSYVLWDTAMVERDASGSAGTSKVFLNTAGWYEVTVLAVFSASTSGFRRSVIQLNGVDVCASQMNPTASGSLAWSFTTQSVECTSPGEDYLQVEAYTSAGTGISFTTSGRLSLTFTGA